MAYQVLAGAAMVVHFAFLAYVMAGGFAAWRWPRAIWPHLLAAGWGLSTVVFRLACPLTWLEDWARRRAGETELGASFIDTYLTGVVYPQRYAGLLQLLAGVVVAASWAGVLLRRRPPGRVGASGPRTRNGTARVCGRPHRVATAGADVAGTRPG